jgi:hypothetical protein
MSFIEKAIVDIQENVTWVQYDVGGFFDGSIVNNSSTDVLKVRLKYPSRQLDIIVKPGFMLQMSDIFLDLILCSGSYSICGLVKSKAQKLPVLNFAGVGVGRNYVLNTQGVAVNPSTEESVKALVDDTIKGVLRSLGDAGPSPSIYTGKTALKLLADILTTTTSTSDRFYYPGHAETFTTTPLGANAVYYSPSRDFAGSRLGHAGCIGIADQPSDTDGVYAQLSLDSINWDYKGAYTTANANVGVSLLQTVYARYLRFVWANGATAQTMFRFGGRYFI